MTNPTPATPVANATPSTVTQASGAKIDPAVAKVEPAAMKAEPVKAETVTATKA